MDIREFFQHWQIQIDPFAAEEAGKDRVFNRLGRRATHHPEFEKILGDPARPSTSIICGEKGSGKSTLRLQINQDVQQHNEQHPDQRCLVIPYHDLNPILERIWTHIRNRPRSEGRLIRHHVEPQVDELFFDDDRRLSLQDHIDAFLHVGVKQVIDELLGDGAGPVPLGLDAKEARRAYRRAPKQAEDLATLQAVYDEDDPSGDRLKGIRRITHAGGMVKRTGRQVSPMDRYRRAAIAKRVKDAVRPTPRDVGGIFDALANLDEEGRRPIKHLYETPTDARYDMINRLIHALSPFGVVSIVVVLDQIDEPSFIRGDTRKMWALIRPLLQLKFLNQERVGFKLLLPSELRRELLSHPELFEQARLDKMNFIPRFRWTGTRLFELCTARINASRAEGAEDVRLDDLFAEDVKREELVEALDQMRQPRDAFKMLYRCMHRHCDKVLGDEQAWRVPRDTFLEVLAEETQRVGNLQEGLAPA